MKKFIKSVFCLLSSLLVVISVSAYVPVVAEFAYVKIRQ